MVIMRFKAEDMIYDNFQIEVENVHWAVREQASPLKPKAYMRKMMSTIRELDLESASSTRELGLSVGWSHSIIVQTDESILR